MDFLKVEKLKNGYMAVRKAPVAALIAKNLNNEYIFLKHLRPVINEYVYEIPSGHINKGESPRKAAEREFFEETGIRGLSKDLLFYGYVSPGFTDEEIFIFSGIVPWHSKDCCLDRFDIICASEIDSGFLTHIGDMKTALAVSLLRSALK